MGLIFTEQRIPDPPIQTLNYAIGKQQRHRSAQAIAQFHQCLCYLLPR